MRNPEISIAAILAVVAVAGFSPEKRDFDIEVFGLNVLATQNHTPVSSSLSTGQAGWEYYLQCGFTPNGSGGPSAVQFRFLVNGQVVRDVQAPVQSGEYVAMGQFWTPPSAGTYTLVCEANPNKTFPESSYANNARTKQFVVSGYQRADPSGPVRARPAKTVPTAKGRVSPGVARVPIAPDIRVESLFVQATDANGSPGAVAESGYVGRTYLLTCLVEPLGHVESADVQVVLRAEGQAVADDLVPVSAGLRAHWTPEADGIHQLECEANPQRRVPEATFANNTAEVQFPIAAVASAGARRPLRPVPPSGPVFRVPKGPPGPEGPLVEGLRPDLLPDLEPPEATILFPLELQVVNQGNGATPASRVRITWSLTCHNPGLGSSTTVPVGPVEKLLGLPPIPPGQSYPVPGLGGASQYCTIPPGAVAGYPICDDECHVEVVVDPDGMVHETDEANNAVSVQVERRP